MLVTYLYIIKSRQPEVIHDFNKWDLLKPFTCETCPFRLHRVNPVYITPEGVKFLCYHGSECDVM